MAGDVNEHIFSEKQLYTGDVLAEDGEDIRLVLSDGGNIGAAGSIGAIAPSSGGATSSKPAGAARERRRKRAAERATKIVYWLESKYDILTEVCAGYENWKEAPSANYDFDLLWCDQAIQADRFMKLKPYQKMNHFVGMSSITRKNNLGRNLLRMRKQFPKEYRFFPDTWILPTDLSDFKLQFQSGKGKTFIIKPDNGCQGKGIFLIRDVEKVPVDFSTTHVAQRYVHKPFLLDGYKFDLRLYVLVVGCDPLRIFLHRHGLVRLASEQYVEPSGKNIAQTMVHLTNYAINKMNPNFEENTNPTDAQDGHKRSWEAVHQHLRKEGHDVETLLQEIEDLIIKTLIAVQPSLSHFYHSCQPDDVENAMCFEVLGFDVILDHKLQPWLLEVNHAPSFATESELDRVVKSEVLKDTFTLLNLCPEARRQKKRELREKMEQRAMGTAKKRDLEEQMSQAQGIAIERTTWEDAHLNGYKRLYPSAEKEREYMPVHDAAINIWEMLMGGTSRRSVRLTTQTVGEEDGRADSHNDKAERPRRSKVRPGDVVDGKAGEGKEGQKEARTAEELREVMERLMAGVSARPRASERRRGSKDAEDRSAQQPGDGEEDQQGASSKPEAELRPQLMPRQEVRVGDVVKVQTNLGWETVIVRVKRANGRVDIQFKDGEYMRSVMPRILKEANPVRATSSGREAGGGGSSSSSAPAGATSSGAPAAAAPQAPLTSTQPVPQQAVVAAPQPPVPTQTARQSNKPSELSAPAATPVGPVSSAVRVGAASPSSRAPSVTRGRGGAGPTSSMPLPGAASGSSSVRGTLRSAAPLASAAPTRNGSSQEVELQQQLKHLFRVRTVNL